MAAKGLLRMAAALGIALLPLVTGCTTTEQKVNISRPIREVAVIGNSITRHGPSPSIGWEGDWGMAATAPEKDFFHILEKRLSAWLADRQAEPPKFSICKGCVVEKDFSSWQTEPVKEADILIIELGDNFRRCEGFDPEKHFISLYTNMLQDFFARNPAQRIFCVGSWGDNDLSAWIQTACERTGAHFVSVADLMADPSNRAKSEGHFTHGGVNWHPGDKGMAGIADTLFRHITAVLQKEQ